MRQAKVIIAEAVSVAILAGIFSASVVGERQAEIPPPMEELIAEAPEQTSVPQLEPFDREIDMLAKTVWAEARGCSQDEWRLVVWTVLQRVDDDRWPDSIEGVVTAKRQFAYSETSPVDDEIRAVCAAEFADWVLGAAAPTLAPYAPESPYYFFDGDSRHNWFRKDWKK
jgi:spore germination cell wall hydrolase CwlJ-like protein